MSYTKWKIKEEAVALPEMLEGGYSPLLSAILHARGYDTKLKADAFIKCMPSLLEDPFLMADMQAAVSRITKALESGEKIAVFGDYDVDGITSACLVADYLKARGAICEIYIPSRIEDGYGVNSAAITRAAARGVTLIITVDCGITAIDEALCASSLGIDLIITDHHECRQELPVAVAVVDPKRPDCGYPNRDLAGVGVAFKLLCALEGGHEATLEKYCDLVAVGTVADVMPLTGENRYIVQKGLKKLNCAPCPGLCALIAAAGLEAGSLSAMNIGFALAPRINAAGRLGSADTAVNLLMSDNAGKAEVFAAQLCKLNRERQELEAIISQEAELRLADRQSGEPIVLASESWHQGVIGISASKLTDVYKVPAIMICLDGEMGKGSCRSYGGFNLFDALSYCAPYLDGYGGHVLAAGLTVARDKIDDFRAAFCEYYRQNPPLGEPTLDIDLRISDAEMLSMSCIKDLELLEPCGSQNPRALLCIEAAQVVQVTPIGGGKHLKLKLSAFGQTYDSVYFSKTLQEANFKPSDCVDVAFCPQINEFRSRQTIQLVITDLKLRGSDKAAMILSGGEISKNLASPTREDFVKVWRCVKCAGGQISGNIQHVFKSICPGMQEERLAVCLKVFEELELLHLSFDGKTLGLHLREDAAKVDLSSSRILSSLL